MQESASLFIVRAQVLTIDPANLGRLADAIAVRGHLELDRASAPDRAAFPEGILRASILSLQQRLQ